MPRIVEILFEIFNSKEPNRRVTHVKNCLSNEEIERMINEAKKYKAEDEAAGARITAKNTFESYLYDLCNFIKDKKFKLETAVNETIAWLDVSQEVSEEDYDEKLEGLEATANAIVQKIRECRGSILYK